MHTASKRDRQHTVVKILYKYLHFLDLTFYTKFPSLPKRFNLIGQAESQMLHTKFRGNRSTGSGGNFEGVLPYIGMVTILVM